MHSYPPHESGAFKLTQPATTRRRTRRYTNPYQTCEQHRKALVRKGPRRAKIPANQTVRAAAARANRDGNIFMLRAIGRPPSLPDRHTTLLDIIKITCAIDRSRHARNG